jgi:hypothetical protein
MRKKYPTSGDTGDEELAKEAILVRVGTRLIDTAELAVSMMPKIRKQMLSYGIEIPLARWVDELEMNQYEYSISSYGERLYKGSLSMSKIDGATVLVSLVQKLAIDNQEALSSAANNYSYAREARYHEALRFGLSKNKKFKSQDLKEMLKITNPHFTVGLFKQRAYVAKVRYIGENEGFFVNGEIYETKTFNGAMYAIKGCSGKIGMSYFEDA